MRSRAIFVAVCALLLSASSASAELLRVEIKTLGSDCDTCAHAVLVAMQKVDGIKSVAVSLNEGVTVLELREGNTVTLAELRTVIKDNGLVSKDANVVARGALVGDLFEVRFSRERHRVRGRLAKLASDRWTLVVPAN